MVKMMIGVITVWETWAGGKGLDKWFRERVFCRFMDGCLTATGNRPDSTGRILLG